MNNEPLKQYVKLFLIASAVVYLQNIVSNLFVLNKVWYPDISILLIVLIGQIEGMRKSILIGFYIGFMQDLSTDVLGIYALSKTIIGLLAAYFPFDIHYNRTKFVYSLITLTSVHHLIYFGLIFYGYITFYNSLIKYMIPNMLYTVFLGSIIYFLLEKWIIGLYGERK